MQRAAYDTIDSLRKELMHLGGLKSPRKEFYRNEGIACMNEHFPNGHFPTASVHEFICPAPESMAASLGFVAALNTILFSPEAVIAWQEEIVQCSDVQLCY